MTQTELRTKSGPAARRRPATIALPRPLGRWEAVELAGEGTWSQVYRARPFGAPPNGPRPTP